MMLVELVLYAVTFVGGTRIAYQKKKTSVSVRHLSKLVRRFQNNRKK